MCMTTEMLENTRGLMGFKRKTLFNKSDKMEVFYFKMYHRIKNKGIKNPLFDDFSNAIIQFKMGRSKNVEYFFFALNDLLPNDCVIIPYVSAFSKEQNYLSVVKLARMLCTQTSKRLSGDSWINYPRYFDKIAESYREKLEPNSLQVDNSKIQGIYNKHVIMLTDISTNNMNSYLSHYARIKKYQPKKISIVSLGFYVET